MEDGQSVGTLQRRNLKTETAISIISATRKHPAKPASHPPLVRHAFTHSSVVQRKWRVHGCFACTLLCCSLQHGRLLEAAPKPSSCTLPSSDCTLQPSPPLTHDSGQKGTLAPCWKHLVHQGKAGALGAQTCSMVDTPVDHERVLASSRQYGLRVHNRHVHISCACKGFKSAHLGRLGCTGKVA